MTWKWEFGLVFYKFAENREFFQGRFLPYKLGIETPELGSWGEIMRRLSWRGDIVSQSSQSTYRMEKLHLLLFSILYLAEPATVEGTMGRSGLESFQNNEKGEEGRWWETTTVYQIYPRSFQVVRYVLSYLYYVKVFVKSTFFQKRSSHTSRTLMAMVLATLLG